MCECEALACGDQRERWVGSGLMMAEEKFRRVKGYKQIPALLKQLEGLEAGQKTSCAAEEGLVEYRKGRAATFNASSGILSGWEKAVSTRRIILTPRYRT